MNYKKVRAMLGKGLALLFCLCCSAPYGVAKDMIESLYKCLGELYTRARKGLKQGKNKHVDY